MKTPITSLKVASAILAVAGFALNSQAIPITGAISFSGTATMDGTSFLTATKFTSFQDVDVGAASALSGSYAGTSGAAVTVTPFTWNPPTASTPINPLWAFMSGGNTYSFDLSALHLDFASTTGLLLSGLGTAHITGPGSTFQDTSGSWNFSSQTLGLATFTFSSTTTIANNVPDGGSTAILLGGSLLGLCAVGRKASRLKNLARA
jgi:protein with PEP-CTERM/exosortase system signal